ncbi:hypothetical protein [Nostoc flagelliforme]|uniref:hypothetical protein n=1 Tax=Nostoc flagelliforme TaxID=1306274 RepID=UPI0018EF87D0|nr:hypothetical protein [Nostoc flagelliforme]
MPPCLLHRHTPINEDRSNNWGGLDTDPELSDSWWERVKYYARLAVDRVEDGVDADQRLLSTLRVVNVAV